MLVIWLSEEGGEIYPHLINEWLTVYGYDPISRSFIIWDEIMYKWVNISVTLCEGRNNI